LANELIHINNKKLRIIFCEDVSVTLHGNAWEKLIPDEEVLVLMIHWMHDRPLHVPQPVLHPRNKNK